MTDINSVISSLLGNGKAIEVTDLTFGEVLERYGSQISSMVILPSGNGHFILDEESEQERSDKK
jgi:hypothetical protein